MSDNVTNKQKELEEYFILEEKCDIPTIVKAIVNSNEIFAVNDVIIAIKVNSIYATLQDNNSFIEYDDSNEAKEVFEILKQKLKELL